MYAYVSMSANSYKHKQVIAALPHTGAKHNLTTISSGKILGLNEITTHLDVLVVLEQ